MPSVTGRRLRLSPARRLIDDLLWASRNAPIVTFERRMNLSAVAAARSRLTPPPGLSLLFVKAYAAVAARRPELRRVYLPLPVPHLWEADESVASVVVEREYRGEPAVLFAMARSPDRIPLPELMSALRQWKTDPVDAVRPFRRALRYARLPLPLRRLLWWYATSWSGSIRARNFGTFGISVTASAGAAALNLISPLPTALNYGVLQPDGSIDVRLHFDHRVLDGMPAARALAELEAELNGPIVDELRSLEGRRLDAVGSEMVFGAQTAAANRMGGIAAPFEPVSVPDRAES
jgi:hypothetical protein